MKNAPIFITILTCFLFISFAAFGQELAGFLKWEQLPDMAGYDWSSENLVPSAVADDWICENGMPINRIEWWGSYYFPSTFPYKNSDNFPDPTLTTGTPPGTVTGFYIGIFDNAEQGQCFPWPMPGELLYLTYVAIENANETLYGVATKPGGQQENVWHYSVALDEFFYQELGQKYWIAIMAVDGGSWEPNIDGATFTPMVQWGWHQTDKLLHGWGEDAVQIWENLDSDCWDLLVDTEMAFRLYTIPEPSTGMIILSSLGLLGVIVRKRVR